MKKPLYDRLGGEKGLTEIVDDFVNRMMNDPRVNFVRKGVTKGSILNRESAEWNASSANVAQLKKHFVQFLSLSTGGPAKYDGREMKGAHEGLHISNAEMDAAIGDLERDLLVAADQRAAFDQAAETEAFSRGDMLLGRHRRRREEHDGIPQSIEHEAGGEAEHRERTADQGQSTLLAGHDEVALVSCVMVIRRTRAS